MALLGAVWGVGEPARMAVLRAVTPSYRVETTQEWKHGSIEVYWSFWPEDMLPERIRVTMGGRTVYESVLRHPAAIPVVVQHDGYGKVDGLAIYHGDGMFWSTALFVVLDPTLEGQPRPKAEDVPFVPEAVLEGGYFTDELNADGLTIWRAVDQQYLYYWNPHAQSPAPTLRATIQDGRVVYVDDERAAGPDDATLAEAVAEATQLAGDPGAGLRVWSGPLLKVFFDLVYAGDAAKAWRFFRDAYPQVREVAVEEPPGNTTFCSPASLAEWEASILETMKGSRFIDEVLRRNGGSVEPPPRDG